MRPLAVGNWTSSPTVERCATSPLTIVRGPPGSYVAERLASTLAGWNRWHGSVWLRPQDLRPAPLEAALATACRHRWSDGAINEANTGVDDGLSRHHGRVEPLTEVLAGAPPGAAIVVELGSRTTRASLRMLEGLRIPVAQHQVALFAVIESRFWPAGRRGSGNVIRTEALLDPERVEAMPGLSGAQRGQLVRLAGRRTALLHDAVDAAERWSPEAVGEALDAARGVEDFLEALTGNLLALATPAELAALEICAGTGYWHPLLATGYAQPQNGRPVVPAARLRPWLVPLEEQWGWLRPIWARPLRRRLALRTASPGAACSFPSGGWTAPGAAPFAQPPYQPAHQPAVESAAQPVLQARLFGAFELRVDGAPVTSWNGPRGMSVLRFLLSRHRFTCSRDELLEAFWPDVAPPAARNRLQVAISGLRRALLEVTNAQVIEYADGAYRINPELRVEVDVQQFEHELSAARAAERAGDQQAAVARYRAALDIYRGDLAADAPFEQWTLLPRESRRIAYLDALDRLSRIEFADGDLNGCIRTAHRMLVVDPCREDAHRLLMRSYVRQGRGYQALRQYDFCRRVLGATLEVGPAAETEALYARIRAGHSGRPALVR